MVQVVAPVASLAVISSSAGVEIPAGDRRWLHFDENLNIPSPTGRQCTPWYMAFLALGVHSGVTIAGYKEGNDDPVLRHRHPLRPAPGV